MCKKILCFFCVLVFAAAFTITVSAADDASFSLGDVSVNKNRLFDTNLSASCDVAAFVAEITYNPEELRFDKAKALSENAYISVNNDGSGIVTMAYLCENEASGDLIKLSFKSFTSDTSISLEVSQVIDMNGNDITVSSAKGAFVAVSGSSQGSDTKQSNKSSVTKTESAASQTETSLCTDADANEINLSAKDNGKLKLIGIVVSVSAVLGIGAISFYLGRKSGRKNK